MGSIRLSLEEPTGPIKIAETARFYGLGSPISVQRFISLVEARKRYRFGLDWFEILNTRARHEDTVFASISVAVADRPAVTTSRALGDLNNGHYNLGLVVNEVFVGKDENAVMTYAIINNGHSDPGVVGQILEKAMSQLATEGAKAATTAIGSAVGASVGATIGTGVLPIVGTALGALAGYLVGATTGLIFANCDGPVAAGFHVFSGSELKADILRGGSPNGVDDHPGVDSPAGCGSNSHYRVAWSVNVSQ